MAWLLKKNILLPTWTYSILHYCNLLILISIHWKHYSEEKATKILIGWSLYRFLPFYPTVMRNRDHHTINSHYIVQKNQNITTLFNNYFICTVDQLIYILNCAIYCINILNKLNKLWKMLHEASKLNFKWGVQSMFYSSHLSPAQSKWEKHLGAKMHVHWLIIHWHTDTIMVLTCPWGCRCLSAFKPLLTPTFC